MCSTDVEHNIKIFSDTIKASEIIRNFGFDFDIAYYHPQLKVFGLLKYDFIFLNKKQNQM